MALDRGTLLVPPAVDMADEDPKDMFEIKDIKKALTYENEEKEEKPESTEAMLDRDHMCVYLRVRPFSEDEKNKGEDQGCMEMVSESCMIMHAPEDSHTFKNSVRGTSKAHNKFTFSRIFPEDTSQKEFFDDTMLRTVKEFIDGQNCLIFTYGVTNSGKTYTIQGNANNAGILPRSLDVIFNSIAGKQMDDIILKPKLFCDVTRLSPGQTDTERVLKERVLKMADSEEPDATTLLGPEGDASVMTINSTISEDSLNLNRQSMLSVASSKHSLDKTSLEDIFEESRLREDATVDVELQGPIRFSIWVSFMEIYNDQIFDLLEPPPKKKTLRRTVLQLKEDKNGVPYVRGLKEICVSTADEAYKILTIGKKNLQIACTKLNHNSSRSHCVFTVKMVRVVDKDNPKMARTSMLSFCDLAGSERHSKTQSVGDRMKEAGNINTSLLTLGRCIKTLRHNQLNKEHPRIVPFRDSKLTRIFQSYFCGKGRASMVVNVNQCASLFDETLHALKYSAIAKQVIVVQEAVKEVEPPEKKRKKRVETLLLEQQSSLSRSTIGWATPGTMAKVFEEEEAAANMPLPDDSDEEGGSEEYLDIIEDLKQQLMEEKRKSRKLEREIRAEVSREMAQQLVMIEETYTERMREALESAEDKHDKRIEILTKSIRHTSKRKRVIEDEEENMPSGSLHATQVKLEEREKEKAEVKQQLAAMEQRMQELVAEQQGVQEKCTKLTFDNSAMKEQLQEATGMMEEMQSLWQETQEQLRAAEERLRERDTRIEQLEGLLQGKECTGCRALEDALDQKEDQLTKTQQMIDMMNCEISEKIGKIEALERQQPTSTTSKSSPQMATIQVQTEPDFDEQFKLLQEEIANCHELLMKNEEQLSDKEKQLLKANESQKTQQTKIEDLEKNIAERNKKVSDSEQRTKELMTTLDSVRNQLKAKATELERLNNTADLNAAMRERLNHLEEEAEVARNKLVEQTNKHSRETATLRENVRELQSTLATKELDLTTRGTEIFEILEKRSETETELTKLKEALAAEEREKQETVDALELLKGKLGGVETALDEATTQSTDSDKLRQQVQELKRALEEKSKALDNLTKEVGGLRRSLDNVSILEGSLQQANEMLRQKSLEVTEMQSKLDDKQNHLEKITKECEKMKKDLSENSRKAEDVTAEAKQWEDKFHAENEKFKKICEKLANMEVEVGLLRAENDKTSSESQSNNASVKFLKETLAREKEEHSAQVSELKKSATEKSAKLDKLQSELVKVRANLEGEHKQQLELRSRIQSLESECHTLKRQWKAEKEGCEESRAHVSKLELKLHEGEARRKEELGEKQELETSVQALQEQSAELSRKVEELQEAVTEAEETEMELQEAQAKLEQASQERDRHLASITTLEAQVTQLKSESGAAAAADIEQLENMRCEVKTLQKAVDDAEYKHQMSARQTRREKTQMDKLLRETESAAKEAEDRVSELESELSEVKATQEQVVEDKVNQYRTRATKLEDIVRDLEHCLRSSKDSEAKVTAHNEEYRSKFREQEKRLADLEDSLKELQDAKETLAADSAHDLKCLQAILRDKQEQLDDTKQEIKTLQDLIDRNAFDYGQQMFEKNERINQLEEEAEMLRHQADDRQLHGKIHDLQEQLSVQTAAAKEGTTKTTRLESQLSVLKEESKESNAKLIVLQRQLDTAKETSQQSQHDVMGLQSQVVALTAERDNRCAEIQQLKELLSNEQNNVQDSKSKLSELKEQLIKEKDMRQELDRELEQYQELKVRFVKVNEQLSCERNTIQTVNEKLAKLQQDCKVLQRSDRDKKAQCELLEENLKDCEQELKKSRELTKTLETEMNTLKESSVNSDKLSEVTEQLNELENKLKEKLSQQEEMKSNCENLEEICSKLESELEEKVIEVTELQKEKQEKDEKLESVQGKCSELQEKLSSVHTEQERLVKNKNEEVSSIQARLDAFANQAEEVAKLQSELEELEQLKESQSRDMNALKSEATARENSIQQYNKQIALLKEESEFLNKQLQHSQSNESTLRGQLREANSQMEEQNRKFTQLEDKLHSYDVTIESKATKLKDLTAEMQALKEQVNSLNTQHREKDVEINKIRSDARKAEDRLDLDLKAAKMEIERKDKRLEIKNRKIETLMEDAEKERNRYEIAYKDSQANESVLNKLKTTLEDQEQVMSMQESYLNEKEEEIVTLTDKLHDINEKYNTLLKESADKSSQGRQLEQASKRVAKQEAEITSVLKEVKELKDKVKQLEDAKEKLEKNFCASNSELKKIEASLSDTRTEREALRRELESSHQKEAQLRIAKDELAEEHKQDQHSRAQADQIRTKFLAIEEHSKQLEKEKQHWKDQFNALDARKEKELQKWREERDKLVGKLQEILVQKDSELKALKAGGASADEVKELADLKRQMEDKDAIIAELSSHLESGNGKQRKTRRTKSSRGPASHDESELDPTSQKNMAALQLQLEKLRSEHERELGSMRMTKYAQEEIIAALKNQNKQLEKQLPMHHNVASIRKTVSAGEVLGIPTGTPNTKEENMAIQCSLDDTPSLAENTPVSKPKGKKSRGKKRRSSEMDESNAPDETSTRKSRGGKRKSTRRTKSVKLEESRDDLPAPQVGMCSIREEDVVDLSMINHDQSHTKILHNSTNIIDTHYPTSTPKSELRHATFISPAQSNELTAPPTTNKKKKKLRNTENVSPFSATPSQSSVPVSTTPDAHQIVKRKLRSRKR